MEPLDELELPVEDDDAEEEEEEEAEDEDGRDVEFGFCVGCSLDRVSAAEDGSDSVAPSLASDSSSDRACFEALSPGSA